MVGLARLADRLSGPMGPHEIIETIVAEVPTAAGMDYADVALVRGETLVSPQVRWPLGPELVEQYASTPLDAHLPTTEAARTGTSIFVESLLDYQDGHPELQEQVTASGFVAAAVVPMRSVDGDVFGVLGLVSRTPVEFDQSLVAAIELAGSLCSLALRRTHLGERASALAVLASGLAGAVTRRDVATVVRDLAPAVVGAHHTNCWVPDANMTSFAPLVETSVRAEVASRYRSLPIEADTPIRDALVNGAAVWLREHAEIEARYPS
jgi:GAF domain-containing protein